MTFVYQIGGSLPADAPSYIERQCDRDYYELLKAAKYCYVFNCRQMGKSSLRVRVTQKLQSEGVVCATIDPQKIGVEVTCDKWYASAIRSLVGELNLKERFDLLSWLKEREMLSPVQRFAEFIETIVLREINTPIVIFVEEIDRLLSLKFGMDDFFGLVRSFFEDRPTKPAYKRLTFSFLGVATPTDLIKSGNISAFNIGSAVEMAGFTLAEAMPLVQGLAGKVDNPQTYLELAVQWTGGQPFLIQRLLGLIEKELEANSQPPEHIAAWVEDLVQRRIVNNWESQDAPPHLMTIRDRVLSVEEKLRGRMLGCYQQVLAGVELDDDRSEERSKLRLTGLVVRRDGKLRSYNPIYALVFNNHWVEQQLASLRPAFYAEAFRAWHEAEAGQNEGFLLRGQALEEVEVWARGKRLSDADEQFLRESREMERLESTRKLEAEQQARAAAEQERLIAQKQQEVAKAETRILGEAKRKADQRVWVGSIILVATILAAAVAGVSAIKFVNEAKDAQARLDQANLDVQSAKNEVARIKEEAKNIKQQANKDSLKAAADVKDAVTKKQEADRKVGEAKQGLQEAKAELENVSQKSAKKIASAQAKIADAEVKIKESLQKEEQAHLESQKSAEKVAAAEKKIADTEAKVKKDIKTRLQLLVEKGIIQGLDEKKIEAIANGDIDILLKVPIVPIFSCKNYGDRQDLGNTQEGDSSRFKGRGYIQITGRAYYDSMGKKIGVDLIKNPEKASEPQIAAMTLIQWMDDNKIKELVDLNNLNSARRRVNGGLNGIANVNSKYQIYLKALNAGNSDLGILQIAEIANPEWLKVHVPAILKGMREKNITDTKYKAYILATADHESAEGKFLADLCQ